jgi:23S rRNA pseudouridine2605 synthase
VPAPEPTGHDGQVRLQKLLAQSGVASRRSCEELMLAGRVEVDGEVVTRLGTKVDPARAVIRVDGRRLPPQSPHVYLVLNKPRGVVSTMSDPQGRRSLGDLVADRAERLFHVGRLDTDTEGLLLLTNDGELAHRLSHPSYEVVKVYLAEVQGPVARDVGKRLKAGVELEDGVAHADAFRVVTTSGGRYLVEVSLHEGRKHIVRLMLEAVGHPVSRLVRTDVGPISIGNLKPGKHRRLSQQEVGALFAAVGL